MSEPKKIQRKIKRKLRAEDDAPKKVKKIKRAKPDADSKPKGKAKTKVRAVSDGNNLVIQGLDFDFDSHDKHQAPANVINLGAVIAEGGERNIRLDDYARGATYNYGTYVVENRALPDYRDGLKPVHRRILWSMYNLGLKSNSPPKKSARTIGDTLGMYHPHGDLSVYEALVGITGVRPEHDKTTWARVNSPMPMVEGEGNFGDHVDGAAAMRYTEARLSHFAEFLLLDPDYLAVTPMVQNFSGDALEPVVLPSKVPNILLQGMQGIAVGLSSNIPSFEFSAVIKCAELALTGKLSAKRVEKALSGKFNYQYGGFAADESELPELIKTGKGRIIFSPDYETDGKDFTITSVAPNFKMTNKSTKTKILKVENTGAIRNETGDTGIRYVIKPKRKLSENMFNAWAEKIAVAIQVPSYFELNVTDRHNDGTVTPIHYSILELLENWAKWRIDLERRVIAHKQANLERSLERTNVLLIAIANLEVIVEALKKDGTTKIGGKEYDATTAHIMRKLDLTETQVEIILETKIRQLKALEDTKLKAIKKKLTGEIKVLKADYKKPVPRIVTDLKAVSY